jgi:hypothetical protein
MKLNMRKFAGSIDGDEEMQLAFSGSHLCNVDLEVANRVGFKLLLWSVVAINVEQPFNAMTLKATVKRRTGQVWNGWLQG